MSISSYSAIILAAGFSSRMGSFKPQLSIGNISVLERGISLFRCAGIENIQVVLGHRAENLMQCVDAAGANWCINSCFHKGMLSSVITGVENISHDSSAFMVLPVDIPLVALETISALIKAHETTDALIIHPVRNGKRGHPPLISSALIKELVRYDGSGGLKSFLAQYSNDTFDVSVPDRFIHLDMDTPEDYLKLVDLYDRIRYQDRFENSNNGYRTS